MFKNKSEGYAFSTYDWWGAVRGVLIFLLVGIVVNIDAFETLLNGFNINPFFGTMIIWGVVDLARRFATDYTK